jgi:hypothetical protein
MRWKCDNHEQRRRNSQSINRSVIYNLSASDIFQFFDENPARALQGQASSLQKSVGTTDPVRIDRT